MFYKGADDIYRVRELEVFPWLEHGFGTRGVEIGARFGHLATVKQVHSARCIEAEGRAGLLGEGDGLLENRPGCVVAIKTADCIPVLLVDERRRAVAAVHAGWRGTAAGIVREAVGAMGRRFGTCAEDLHAAIGPGIGACCYEVGEEVAAHFGVRGRGRIDLAGANRRQLEESGVTAGRIHASKLCTMCGAREFDSFRRDGEAAGRMYSFAGIR